MFSARDEAYFDNRDTDARAHHPPDSRRPERSGTQRLANRARYRRKASTAGFNGAHRRRRRKRIRE